MFPKRWPCAKHFAVMMILIFFLNLILTKAELFSQDQDVCPWVYRNLRFVNVFQCYILYITSYDMISQRSWFGSKMHRKMWSCLPRVYGKLPRYHLLARLCSRNHSLFKRYKKDEKSSRIQLIFKLVHASWIVPMVVLIVEILFAFAMFD